jgi:hypothetical protein
MATSNVEILTKEYILLLVFMVLEVPVMREVVDLVEVVRLLKLQLVVHGVV